MSVIFEIGNSFLQRLLLRWSESLLVFGQPLAESTDEIAHLSLQEGIEFFGSTRIRVGLYWHFWVVMEEMRQRFSV